MERRSSPPFRISAVLPLNFLQFLFATIKQLFLAAFNVKLLGSHHGARRPIFVCQPACSNSGYEPLAKENQHLFARYQCEESWTLNPQAHETANLHGRIASSMRCDPTLECGLDPGPMLCRGNRIARPYMP